MYSATFYKNVNPQILLLHFPSQDKISQLTLGFSVHTVARN